MLIRLPFPMAFKPMQGNMINLFGWHMLEEGDILFVLASHNLTKARMIEQRINGKIAYAEDMYFAGIAASRFLWGFQSQSSFSSVSHKDIDSLDTSTRAQAEYEKTGQVAGCSVLVGDRMAWVSHFDVELLQPYAF